MNLGDKEFHPFGEDDEYVTESDESGSEGSGSEDDSGSDSDTHSLSHDGRMAALERWKQEALMSFRQTATAQPIVPPRTGGSGGTAAAGTILTVPLDLRSNDIKRHILSIDSKFRDSGSDAGDFWFRLVEPIKNVLRIRVTSIELPNNYRFFTSRRLYTTLTVWKPAATVGGTPYTLTIPDGNYQASDAVTALTAAISREPELTGVTVAFDEVTGTFTWCAPYPFALDTATGSHNRPFSYGLGWFLGFSRGVVDAVEDPSGSFCLSSDGCADFIGDKYLLLKVNDFDCITHTVSVTPASPTGAPVQENAITALAKVILRQSRRGDHNSQHNKSEVVFQNPRDLRRFHIQLLDEFGEAVDMCSAQFSFSLEVLEVLNPSLYDTVRDGLLLRYN